MSMSRLALARALVATLGVLLMAEHAHSQ